MLGVYKRGIAFLVRIIDVLDEFRAATAATPNNLFEDATKRERLARWLTCCESLGIVPLIEIMMIRDCVDVSRMAEQSKMKD